jgi:hypothetical protein
MDLKFNENFYFSTKLTKKDIILKLKQFWKKKDQSITMDKLCEGLSRITSAGVFFELLGKQKKLFLTKIPKLIAK